MPKQKLVEMIMRFGEPEKLYSGKMDEHGGGNKHGGGPTISMELCSDRGSIRHLACPKAHYMVPCALAPVGE